MRWILILLLPGIAYGLQSLWGENLSPRIWFFFYPVQFAGVFLCNWRGGVVVTLLSAVLVTWGFMEPRHSFGMSDQVDRWGLIEFLTVGLLFSWLGYQRKRQATLIQGLTEQRDYAELFQTMFEQAPLGIALIDSLNGRLYEVNDRYAAIVGRSREEMITIDWMRITHPDDLQEDLDNMARLNAGEIPGFWMEKRYLKPDGDVVWVSMTIRSLSEVAGERPRHLCMVEDITERREQQQALVEAREQLARADLEARLRLATEASGIGVWYWDLLQSRHDWSPICREHLALPAGATPGHDHFMAVLHPDDREPTDQRIQDALHDGGHYSTEYRVARPEGGYRWIRASGRVVFDERGEPTAFMGITEDISQRKQNERNLIESEQRFRSLFDHLPIAYQSLDLMGCWLDANQKTADLLGFESPEAMRGKEFIDYWDDSIKDQFDRNFDEFKRTHNIEGVLLLHRIDGTPITVQVAGRIQRDADGRFLRTHCILIDMTERERMERQIVAMNLDLEQKVALRTEQLQAAIEAKGRFLASMSHEIRTPMNAVLGIAQMLEEEPLPAEAMGMVRRIRAAGGSLMTIINDILDYSKIEAGQLGIEKLPFRLSELLEGIDSLMGGVARGKGLVLAIENRVQGSDQLIGDALRLEQILNNLVGNAIKFTEAGTITLQVKPIPSMSESEPLRLRFEVRDTGIGMSAEQLSRLFQAYSQADGSIARRFGGTGLGLTICKQLVELMGGRIGAESAPGQGSTFWFELSLVPLAETAPPENPLPEESGPGLDGLRVLVADDAQLNLFIADKALSKRGAIVTLAINGEEAVALLRAQPEGYDLVLMDVQMPVMDGLEAMRHIRRDLKLERLPIIALTAGVMAEERMAALEAGATDFMGKPMNLNQLSELIRKYSLPAEPPSR